MNQELDRPVSTTPTNYISRPAYMTKPESLNTLWVWWLVLLISGASLSFFFIGIPLVIAGAVIGFIMLFRWWSIIQDGKPRTTPGQAIGFCFIPFFNLYWFFVAFVGLVKDMNSYCREKQIPVRISEGLAITYYIFLLITILTLWTVVFIFIISIPTFIIGAILFKSINDGAIKILKSKQ